MNFLTMLLVQLWDKFKAKNAKVATLIVLLLGTVVYFADQGTLMGVFPLPEWLAGFIEFLGMFLMAVQGSRTTADLREVKAIQAEKTMDDDLEGR